MTLPRGAMGWSEVCDCGIIWSYSFTFFSILGPLLVLISINDFSLIIEDSIRTVDLYADYTTLYNIGLDIDMLGKYMQHSLNLL